MTTFELGSPVKVGKTRAAFFLRTTPLTRAARRASKTKLTHFARKPNKLIDMKTIRAEVLPTLSNKESVMVLNRKRWKRIYLISILTIE